MKHNSLSLIIVLVLLFSCSESKEATLENFNLKKLSNDSVDLSCVMILPLMVKGSAASSIRPVAIGPSTS